MQRGLVKFGDAQGGGVQITGVNGRSEPQPQTQPFGIPPAQMQSQMQSQQNALDPLFEGTRLTQEDVRTLSSVAMLLVASLALWEVIR